MQRVLGAVQVPPVQQAWPAPPQLPQLPFMHIWPFGQLLLAPTQLPATQQPPPAHMLPAQQNAPGVPHEAQMPLPPPLQTVEVPLQTRPGQQVWPGSPQTTQVPPRQVAPAAVQVLLAQQGWPASPHA